MEFLESPAPKGNRNIVLKSIFTLIGVFFLVLVIVSISQGGFRTLVKPSMFLSNISSAFNSFFSAQDEFIARVPLSGNEETEIQGPCAFETLEKINFSPVIFNEIAWMGEEGNYYAEWIELKNVSDGELDISFLQIVSEGEKIRILIPSGRKLQSGEFFLLSRLVKNQGKVKGEIEYNGALNNKGIGLRLFNSSCELVDEVPVGAWSAGDNKSKRTMERNSSGGWQTSFLSGGTPNAENSKGIILSATSKKPTKTTVPEKSTPTLQTPQSFISEETSSKSSVGLSHILINEISPGSEVGSGDEFIELLNPNDEKFYLTGWKIMKKSSTEKLSSLVSVSRLEGVSIPPNGLLLLANEGGYSGNPSADVFWAKSNTIAYSNNSLILINPDGVEVFEVSWVEIPKEKSYSRAPDGNFYISDKSPKEPN